MSDHLQQMRDTILTEAENVPPGHCWVRETSVLFALHGATGAIALLIAASLLGHFPAWRGSGAPAAAIAVVLVLVAAIRPGWHSRRLLAFSFLALGWAVASHFVAFLHEPTRTLLVDADCALAELGIAIVPAAATVWLLRQFAYDRVRAILGGSASALTGLAVLDLTCPADGAAHVLLFHLLPAALVVLAIVLIRRRSSSRTFVP